MPATGLYASILPVVAYALFGTSPQLMIGASAAAAALLAAQRRLPRIPALGAANLAATISQSFVVTGSGPRTAIVEAAGGRTQVAGLVSAGIVVVVLLFLTAPLRFVPTVSLAAILIVTGISLINWKDLRAIHRIEPQEFWLATRRWACWSSGPSRRSCSWSCSRCCAWTRRFVIRFLPTLRPANSPTARRWMPAPARYAPRERSSQALTGRCRAIA